MDGTPELEAARTRLAAAQHELLAALVAGGPAPAGFDSERLRVQTASLVAKRRDGMARAWPEVAAALGPRLRPLFDAYAATCPRPARGGARADGQAFIEYLVARGERPPGIRPVRWWRRPAVLRRRRL